MRRWLPFAARLDDWVPPHCSVGSANGRGRGLFVSKAFKAGETIFQEAAVVDSGARKVTSQVFLTEAKEPAWALMAQAVQLYLGQGDPRHPAGTAHRRWRLLKSFYRPADRADEPERATYQRHAEQMHEMMGPDLHEQVKVEVLVDLLEVIRLDAHTVREPFYWLHLANHSCWPNAFFQSSRNEQEDYATMTLLALRPLDPGDEVRNRGEF
ncbi:unnamed protein product [Effrenium voratum]|nr:unnamed protein product [Effrenium voratum]